MNGGPVRMVAGSVIMKNRSYLLISEAIAYA
jgi:hypothetical protein